MFTMVAVFVAYLEAVVEIGKRILKAVIFGVALGILIKGRRP